MRPWKTLARHTAFEAPPYLAVTREVVEVAPGHVIEDFWQVTLRPSVTVVPVLEDGRVMTLTSYRHGPRRVCLSLPGGFIDPGETAQAAALRELAEETGLAPGRMIALGDYVGNGNQRGGHGHSMLALGCHAVPGRLSDPAEDFVLAAMTVAEVDAALTGGRFGVIHDVAGWLLARRHPEFPPA